MQFSLRVPSICYGNHSTEQGPWHGQHDDLIGSQGRLDDHDQTLMTFAEQREDAPIDSARPGQMLLLGFTDVFLGLGLGFSVF